MHRLTIRSRLRQELIDVTAEIREVTDGWTCPAVLVYVPHTTAGVLINEHADPDVARDVLLALDQIVSDRADFRHAEGNSPAHVKTILVGSSQMVMLDHGSLMLGTWQGIFLAEFDGPRNRQLWVVPLESGA